MSIQQDESSKLHGLMPQLARRARRLSANASDADDLVQETILNVLLAQKTGRPIQHLPKYCMTVLRHQAYRQWRKTREAEPLTDDVAQVLPDAPMRLAYAETQAAIQKLPPAQHELMMLIASGEARPARLAQLTGVPLGTVMSRLARARTTLRTQLNMAQGGRGSDFMP